MTPAKDLNLTLEEHQDNEIESITLKCRWLMEGILLPSVGCIGTIGKHTIWENTMIIMANYYGFLAAKEQL